MTDKQIIIYKKECYNEPHCSLNQVLEQLNAYKMEADEGKEINAELKAELTRANCQIADDEILQCDMREAIEKLEADLEQEKALKETYLACYKAKHEDIEGELFNLKAENDELRQILWNVDVNRQSKGKKLIRIEELLKKCATGYTDEFIQEMFSILYELEPVCRYNKLEQLSKTLTEIKEIIQNQGHIDILEEQILQKISEVEDA